MCSQLINNAVENGDAEGWGGLREKREEEKAAGVLSPAAEVVMR
jgi:hypothetical protein